MKIKKILWTLLIICILTFPTQGQNSISISKNSTVSIDLTDLIKTTMSGETYTVSNNWLNYSAIVNPSESTLSVSAEISSGQVPAGFKMHIQALPYKGLALGGHGTPTGKMQLAQIPRVIVENIGTSYTGAGPDVGHQLLISFEIEDFSLVEPGISFILIEFTMK
ncbi:hypothetical protein ACFLSI_02350 [Bacteroidota bacterium]